MSEFDVYENVGIILAPAVYGVEGLDCLEVVCYTSDFVHFLFDVYCCGAEFLDDVDSAGNYVLFYDKVGGVEEAAFYEEVEAIVGDGKSVFI